MFVQASMYVHIHLQTIKVKLQCGFNTNTRSDLYECTKNTSVYLFYCEVCDAYRTGNADIVLENIFR